MSSGTKTRSDFGVARRPVSGLGLCLAVGLMTLAAGSGPASAAIYQQTKSTTCDNNDCGFFFGEAGPGKRLFIDNVSCTMTVAGTQGMRVVALTVDDGYSDLFVPELIGGTDDEKVYAFNQQTTYMAESGKPVLLIATSSGDQLTELTCTVAGQQVPAN